MVNVGQADKTELSKCIWKVFIILLEFSCRSEYTFAIEKIQETNAAEIDNIHRDYKNQLHTLELEKLQLQKNLKIKDIIYDQQEKDKMNEQKLRSKLEDEYIQMQIKHEEEIKLRLNFEAKLN